MKDKPKTNGGSEGKLPKQSATVIDPKNKLATKSGGK